MVGTSTAQKLCGSLRRETLGNAVGEEVPQQDVQAALRARVRSATRSSLLWVSSLRISTRPSSPSSGWTRVSRSLRRAASAVKVASKRSFLRALPVESTLTFAESLGGTSTTSSPEATSFWARGRPMPVAPSIAQRRCAKRFAQRSSALNPASVGWEGRLPDQLPVLVDRYSGVLVAL